MAPDGSWHRPAPAQGTEPGGSHLLEGTEGKQRKIRQKAEMSQHKMQDKEKGINSAPDSTKAGGCSEKGSQGRSATSA